MAIRRMKSTGLSLACAMLCLAVAGVAEARTDADLTNGRLMVQNPRRVAGGPAGTVLVSDRQYGTVVAVDRDSLQAVWSAQLPAEGRPFGLGAHNRQVFVGNTVTKRVEVYRIKGSGGADTRLSYAYSLAGADGAPAVFDKPIGIGVDPDENLVVVLDGAAKSVSLFRRDGTFVDSFEPRGSDNTLLSPVSLSVDPLRQEILVGDYGDPAPIWTNCSFCGAAAPARILIFDYRGALLSEIRGDGTSHLSTRFARVQGLAASVDGRIFAADPLGSRVLVLDRLTGALLEKLGTEGTEPGQLMLPTDLWFDSGTGDLFISNNRGARRIEVLRGAGGQP